MHILCSLSHFLSSVFISENLKWSFRRCCKMGWRQSKGSFQHVPSCSSPFTRPTRARPCALLRPFIIDYVLSCNKASQSNPPNKGDWYTKDGAAAISHPTLSLRQSSWWAKPWMVPMSGPHLLLNWHLWHKCGKSTANRWQIRVFPLTFEGVSIRLTHEYRPCPIWFLCHTGWWMEIVAELNTRGFACGLLGGVNMDNSVGLSLTWGLRDPCRTVNSLLCIGILPQADI